MKVQEAAKMLPTILLVEDSVDDYNAAMRSFQKVRFNTPVHWCKSGQSALDYLREQQYDLPCLILLDLNMPGLDGRKTLEIIKKDASLKRIPVVILTTSSDENDVKSCYELGASTYIQKPVDFEGLIGAVQRIKEYWFEIALLPGEKKSA